MCACVQGLALHQGTQLVDPEEGDFKRAALPAHGELTLRLLLYFLFFVTRTFICFI